MLVALVLLLSCLFCITESRNCERFTLFLTVLRCILCESYKKTLRWFHLWNFKIHTFSIFFFKGGSMVFFNLYVYLIVHINIFWLSFQNSGFNTTLCVGTRLYYANKILFGALMTFLSLSNKKLQPSGVILPRWDSLHC